MTSKTNGRKRMNVEIAQHLASLRREKGYSQEALATELGLSRQAISKWERAESQPDTGNLIALADLYGVTLDELVRVEADIADDVRFEEAENSEQKEEALKADALKATVAAEQAFAAAARAETAAAQIKEEAAPPSPTPTPAPTPNPAASPNPFPSPDFTPMPGHNPAQAMPPKAPRSPWLTFPYPLLVVILFLLAGFLCGAWNPAWVLFLTIPFYYWIAHVVATDPEYLADRNGHPGD